MTEERLAACINPAGFAEPGMNSFSASLLQPNVWSCYNVPLASTVYLELTEDNMQAQQGVISHLCLSVATTWWAGWLNVFLFGKCSSTRKWNERSTRSRMKNQGGRSRTCLDCSPRFLRNTCNSLSKCVYDVFLTIMRIFT